MAGEVVPREDYYRPNRARELRSNARRLEMWTEAGWALLAGPLIYLGIGFPLIAHSFVVVPLVLAGLWLLDAARKRWLRRADRLRAEAEHLDQEDLAEHGPVRPGLPAFLRRRRQEIGGD